MKSEPYTCECGIVPLKLQSSGSCLYLGLNRYLHGILDWLDLHYLLICHVRRGGNLSRDHDIARFIMCLHLYQLNFLLLRGTRHEPLDQTSRVIALQAQLLHKLLQFVFRHIYTVKTRIL